MNKVALIVIIILIISIVISSVFIYYFLQKDDFDVEIDISTNKDNVKSGEKINLTLKIKNNRDEKIPNEKYYFYLSMIEKSRFEEGDQMAQSFFNDEAEDIIENIEVSPGKTVEEKVPWEISQGTEPGTYYIVFGIKELIEGENPPKVGQSVLWELVKNTTVKIEIVE
jgi:hypothetical protein